MPQPTLSLARQQRMRPLSCLTTIDLSFNKNITSTGNALAFSFTFLSEPQSRRVTPREPITIALSNPRTCYGLTCLAAVLGLVSRPLVGLGTLAIHPSLPPSIPPLFAGVAILASVISYCRLPLRILRLEGTALGQVCILRKEKHVCLARGSQASFITNL